MKKKEHKLNKLDTPISATTKPVHACKNCLTEIDGEYCHFCGQRYHDHKESFGELVYEFASDFLHFDSRFFKTIIPLLFLPGILTKSYNEGKQRSQFHPIRLYLFSSFVYFLLFFSFNNVNELSEPQSSTNQIAVLNDSGTSTSRMDTFGNEKSRSSIPTATNKIDSLPDKVDLNGTKKEFVTMNDYDYQYKFTVNATLDSLLQKKTTPEEYLEQQNKLSQNEKAGFFERIITLRLLKINLQGEEGKKEFFKKVIETFLHNIPKMLFFLLPIFAFLLKLLYFRHKQFFYVDHAILSLHYFSLLFLLLIIANYVLDAIFNTSVFTLIAAFWTMIYLLVAMKRLYKQSWKKTIVKYIALGILFLFTVMLTLMANMALSAFMV